MTSQSGDKRWAYQTDASCLSGIQTFREIREENYYYVDKTALIQRLMDEGKHYFLSRPRRFGKSLFLDTLKELFEGNETLFEGLYIHDHWDWSVRYPVVRLSFGRGYFKEADYLHANVMTQLHTIAEEAGIAPRYDTAPDCFGDLIRVLHREVGQRVVVLVDEYDKPILDALEVPEVARANRDFLRGLYATIKDSDAHIKFTFLTGVSKFSKVSLFSGSQQSQGHHAGCALLSYMRLYRCRPGYGVLSGTARSG